MKIDFGQLRDTWENLHGAIRACLILLLIGMIALVAARPASNLVKQFAASRNLRLAEESMREGAPLEARTRAMSVLQLFPERIEAARLLVDANAAASAPDPAPVAEFLLSHPSATPADRELGFRIIATTTPLAKTGRIWASLPEEERRHPANIVNFGNRLLTEGKPDQAILLLRDIALEDPPDELGAFLVALLVDVTTRSGLKDSKGWSEIQRRLQLRSKKARDRGEELPDWCLDGWESIPNLALDAEAGLASLPEQGSARLEMTRHRMKLRGYTVDLASEPVLGWLGDHAPEQRLSLAKLLFDGGAPDTALGLFETPQALSMSEYDWLRAKRMERAEWKHWKATLTGATVTQIPQMLVQADLAVACERLDQAEESTAAWKEALRIAESRAGGLTLCELSRRLRAWLPHLAHEAMLIAIQRQGEPLPLYADLGELMVYLENSGRDRDLLKLLYAYRHIEPADPVSVTRLAYLALLCGDLTPARAIEMIKPVIEIAPDQAHPRIVPVIAKLLEDDRSGAVEWLGGETVDWTQTPPLARWLTELTLSEAPPLPKPPESKELMPCERDLVKRLLRQANDPDEPPPPAE